MLEVSLEAALQHEDLDSLLEDDPPFRGDVRDAATQTCCEIDWYADGYDFSNESSEMIVSISPSSATRGDKVRVFGYGMRDSTTIYAGLHACTTEQCVNHTELIVTVPREVGGSHVSLALHPVRPNDVVPREQRLSLT